MAELNYSFEKLTGVDNFITWYSEIYEFIKSKKGAKFIDEDYLPLFVPKEGANLSEKNYL